AGVVTEIRHQEGETVAVNTVVAVIGQAGDIPVAAPSAKPAAPPSPAAAQPVPTTTPAPPVPQPRASAPAPSSSTSAMPQAPEAPVEGTTHQRLSPVVRKIAEEHNIDVAQIQGTGLGGRVTRDDILGYIDQQQGKAGHGAPERQPERPQPTAVAA